MTIAVIIARGGSKRLPRKNARSFCGRPLVAWAIIQAKCSKLIDEVWVSTDDDEIEAISIAYGAHVVRRPEWPDADQAAGNRPFIHAVNFLLGKYGDDFDTFLSILPTTPLNKPQDFDVGIRQFRELRPDWTGPLINKRETVILQKTLDCVGRMVLFDKDHHFLGEAGGWIVTTPKWYLNFNSRFSDMDEWLNDVANWPCIERYYFPVECWQYSDVDTAEEFEFAELIMEHYVLKGRDALPYIEYSEGKYFLSPELAPRDEMTEEELQSLVRKKYGGGVQP